MRTRSAAVVSLVWLCAAAFADVYPRRSALDVLHYDLHVDLEAPGDEIKGVTRIEIQMRRDGVSGITLDLEEMRVESVAVGGTARPFTHGGGRLAFDVDRPYRSGETATVEVRYRGAPKEKGLVIGKNRHGQKVYFAENWPDHARYWFPGVDHPSDKATVALEVTAPERYDVVGPGRLVDVRRLPAGRKATRWNEAVPIPTYCMVLGAAEFTILEAGSFKGIPLVHYAYPQDAAAVAQKFARTLQALEFFTDRIGAYPYEKLAQVQATTRIGGMENSSAIFYAEAQFARTPVAEGPMPHEVAHQWFGDSVTPADWDHVWLSEGFATYFDALFYEHLDGAEALRQRMSAAAEKIKKFHAEHPAPVLDTGVAEPAKKLNALSYEKGAWTLHMLRRIVGDEVFFAGIRKYYALYAGRNALSDDFRRVMESTSGRPLGTFFRQWLEQPGWPEYRVAWRWDAARKEVELEIVQEQPQLFEMPLEVAFVGGGRNETRTFTVSGRSQALRVPLAAAPSSVEIDPGGWVLKGATVTGTP
jgi:aminopeptidase N